MTELWTAVLVVGAIAYVTLSVCSGDLCRGEPTMTKANRG